jgi:hypothetical protein
MAKDLAYLRAQTRTYLDEAASADWSDGEVDREINAGYQEVVTAVIGAYEDFYVTSALFNTVANKQEYGPTDGLPAKVYKFRRVELNYSPSQSTRMIKVRATTIDHVMSDLGNSVFSINMRNEPVYYVLGGGSPDYKIGFLPIPIESGTNVGKIWYVQEVDELVDSTDTVNIPYPDRFAPLISRYAASVLLNKGQQEDKSALTYMQLFQTGLLKMEQQLRDRTADGARTVVDTVGADLMF